MHQNLLDWLISHYGQEKMKPGLERIKSAIVPLMPFFEKTKIITIAGTNGKGETSLWLSRYLKNHTHCTWISPHIERINERFVSQNGEIETSVLTALMTECHEKVLEHKYELSFYEFLFFVFCTWASRQAPQYLLLEVGLGGRLDAVNVFDADYLLLPSISRDHQEFLGHRYDQILLEKLALLRPKTLLLSYLSLDYLREKAAAEVSRLKAQWIDLEELKRFQDFDFSARNQFLAYAAYRNIQDLPFESEKWHPVREFLEHRGEVWGDNGEWIFFGSHNPDGLRKLIQFLHSGNYNFTRPPFDAVIIAFSKRSEKDLRVMLKMVRESGLGKIVITSFDHPKSVSLKVIESLASQEGLEFVKDIGPIVQKNNHRLLVAGSYYFIGHFQERFGRR